MLLERDSLIEILLPMLLRLFGMPPTILIKIIIEDPLPSPSSVINSANHIDKTEPVVKARIISKPRKKVQSKINGFTPKITKAVLKQVTKLQLNNECTF